MKVGRVINCLVLPEGNVEFAALVEAAEAIEASAIQIIEELRGFNGFCPAVFDEFVEARAMGIEKLLVVTRFNLHREPTPKLRIEIDQMRIQIVQHRALRLQTQCDRQPSAKH